MQTSRRRPSLTGAGGRWEHKSGDRTPTCQSRVNRVLHGRAGFQGSAAVFRGTFFSETHSMPKHARHFASCAFIFCAFCKITRSVLPRMMICVTKKQKTSNNENLPKQKARYKIGATITLRAPFLLFSAPQDNVFIDEKEHFVPVIKGRGSRLCALRGADSLSNERSKQVEIQTLCKGDLR